MSGFQGKRVFLSGGSEGIGRSAAIKLASQGAHVVVVARRQAALDETVAAMKAAANDANRVLTSLAIDVTDPAAVEAGVATAIERLGGIDIVICNQGFAHTGRIHELPIEDFRRHLEVNYLGHAYVCRAFAATLIQQKAGTIVLVSSAFGYLGAYGWTAYCASKWAIVGFAEALRQEMMLYGVTVKMVYPGTTETPGLARENADKPKVIWEFEHNNAFNVTRQPDDVADRVLSVIPGSRFDNPIGWDGWLSFLASRHLPWLVRMLNDSDIKKAIAKHGEGA
jgi:3-dehydrosphinganine reductase